MAKFHYENYKESRYGVNSQAIFFSLAPNPKEHKRVLTMQWASCRDHVNDAVIAAMNGKTSFNHGDGALPFDMDKLRLLVASSERDKPHIFAGKSAMNIYEKAAGFKGRSKITSIEVDNTTNKEIGAWLITGPKEWMECTQLISMCTLIMRVCKVSQIDPKHVEDLHALEDIWANLKPKGNYHTNDVKSWLPFCWPKWRVLMENFDKIFKGLGPKTLYPADKVGNWHSSGGILNLCRHTTGIEKLDERFKKACKEAGVKQMDYPRAY